MSKLVILDLRRIGVKGTIQAVVEVGHEGQIYEKRIDGTLEFDQQLSQSFKDWQTQYRSLGRSYRTIKIKAVHREGHFELKREVCKKLELELERAFQKCLRSSSFQKINNLLQVNLNPQDEIRLLIRTDDTEMRRLPWQKWELLNSYPNAEIVLSAPISNTNRLDKGDRKDIKILAILGNDERIDIDKDGQFLSSFSPDADVTFLVKPTAAALQDELWYKSWNIFFFAGHSRTEGEQGIIGLNDHEVLNIEVLKEGLKRAVKNGLDIAIFNSCDGLGLAHTLEQVDVPHLIVMKEPIPDPIAQQFLKDLLSILSTQEIPLHLAVREAREKLKLLEDQYPCASGLPILCQNPATPSPTWRSLRTGGHIGGNRFKEVKTKASSVSISTKNRLTRSLVASFLLVAVILGLQSLGIFQKIELESYDHFTRLRPTESPDNRFLVITVNDADKQYQDFLGMSRLGSLSKDALVEIINQSTAYPPRLIGLAIYDDSPITDQLLSVLRSAPTVIFGCEAGESSSKPIGTGPPPNALPENIGFTDLQQDKDNVVRRQILGTDKNEICPTNTSLAFQMAKAYLHEQGYEYEYKNNVAYLGKFEFMRMRYYSGPYRAEPDDFLGYQIPINYRSQNPQSINLTDILNGSALAQEPKLLLDKIVLIGLADNSGEVYRTPYSFGQDAPSIFIHAQMASQIVSAILDGRPLIFVPTRILANVWLYIWSTFGILLFFWARSIKEASIALFSEILIFNGIYMLLFCAGFWLPYATVILTYFLIGLIISASPETVKFFRA